jgi:putative transposase
LRQIEVLTSQGKMPAVALREAGISQQSCYRWRKEYGGLEIDKARGMKDLERENMRLKRLVVDLSLEKQILKDVASETCKPRTAPGRLSMESGRSAGSPNATPAGSSISRAARNATGPLLDLTRMR